MEIEPKVEELPYEPPRLDSLGSLEEITKGPFDAEGFWWHWQKHHHGPPNCDPYS
jgi:hypothetical protein